jgi:hypothetical protein
LESESVFSVLSKQIECILCGCLLDLHLAIDDNYLREHRGDLGGVLSGWLCLCQCIAWLVASKALQGLRFLPFYKTNTIPRTMGDLTFRGATFDPTCLEEYALFLGLDFASGRAAGPRIFDNINKSLLALFFFDNHGF